jgi:hypothetical protein
MRIAADSIFLQGVQVLGSDLTDSTDLNCDIITFSIINGAIVSMVFTRLLQRPWFLPSKLAIEEH